MVAACVLAPWRPPSGSSAQGSAGRPPPRWKASRLGAPGLQDAVQGLHSTGGQALLNLGPVADHPARLGREGAGDSAGDDGGQIRGGQQAPSRTCRVRGAAAVALGSKSHSRAVADRAAEIHIGPETCRGRRGFCLRKNTRSPLVAAAAPQAGRSGQRSCRLLPIRRGQPYLAVPARTPPVGLLGVGVGVGCWCLGCVGAACATKAPPPAPTNPSPHLVLGVKEHRAVKG